MKIEVILAGTVLRNIFVRPHLWTLCWTPLYMDQILLSLIPFFLLQSLNLSAFLLFASVKERALQPTRKTKSQVTSSTIVKALQKLPVEIPRMLLRTIYPQANPSKFGFVIVSELLWIVFHLQNESKLRLEQVCISAALCYYLVWKYVG